MSATRSAKIFLRNQHLLIHAQSQTTTGAWILVAPVQRLDADCPNDVLGAALHAALQNSRTGVPHPKVFTGLANPLLKQAGVQTWGSFQRGATCVGVREDGGAITVMPMRNLGAKEGFQEEPRSASVLADAAAPDLLGGAVRAALAKAS